MEILRFITAGSVDDGKSTLIGRLLYDTKSILADQVESLRAKSKNNQHAEIDLALLTDGLRAEREQGITIDVAYKYFSTAKRKFIIADAPGHIQYTRNMVTGASNCEVSVILIDARKGVIEQTRRHTIISNLLGIKNIIVAVNKMDLVQFDESVYNKICDDYKLFTDKLNICNVIFIPISALQGDNVVTKTSNMKWYSGSTLLEVLENISVDDERDHSINRFQVQYVLRPQTAELHDYRGYAGMVLSGKYKKGDTVKVLPVDIESKISRIEKGGIEVEEAIAGESISILLNDDIDISRGAVISQTDNLPTVSNEIEAFLCWMDAKNLQTGNKYMLQHRSQNVRCVVKEINYKLDINSLNQDTSFTQIQMNDVVHVKIKTSTPLVFDSYDKVKLNGAAILVDETSNNTVAAVIIQK